MTITEKHVLFWSDWPSNFAWAPMKLKCLDGITRRFFSSEQYFMFEKAKHFGDTYIANKILDLDFNDSYSFLRLYSCQGLGALLLLAFKRFGRAFVNLVFMTLFIVSLVVGA